MVNADKIGAAQRLARLAPHMSDDVRRFAVAYTWSQMNRPSQELALDVWVDLWRSGGYSINTEAAPRARRPIVVYRGCTPGGEAALSWSSNREVAEYFTWMWADPVTGKRSYRGPGSAAPLAERPNGRVISALAPPEAMLGEFRSDARGAFRFANRAARRSRHNGRSYCLELVLDPRRIKIIGAGTARVA
jgi:hypothetical protein